MRKKYIEKIRDGDTVKAGESIYFTHKEFREKEKEYFGVFLYSCRPPTSSKRFLHIEVTETYKNKPERISFFTHSENCYKKERLDQ